jgi:uncharacterized membrane protein
MQKIVTRPHEIWLLISHRTAPGRLLTFAALIHTLTAQIGVAAFEASFALDALGWLFSLKPLMTAGYWSLLVAVSSLTIAAFAGTLTRRRWQKEIREIISQNSSDTADAVRKHAYLGVLFYVIVVGVLVWRMELQARPGETLYLSSTYLITAFLVSLIMIFQVWLGGEVAVRLAGKQEK